MKFYAALILAVGLFASRAAAQDQPDKAFLPSIQTTGEAVIQATPDRAEIEIGIVTQAETSQAAATKNAAEVEAVLSALRRQLGDRAQIKTSGYTLSPNYRYPKEGGEPTITGYRATNSVHVTLDDLMQVGKAIDAASGAGANRINNLRFTLKDRESVEAQALTEAARNARKKAEALAAALNLRIIRTLTVAESGSVVPVRDMAFARAEAAATPIEPGSIDVRASVTLSVQIGPR